MGCGASVQKPPDYRRSVMVRTEETTEERMTRSQKRRSDRRSTVRETGTATLRRSLKTDTVTKINQWTLERQLGAGAYGQVWKATTPRRPWHGHKAVAIKIMKRSLMKEHKAGKRTSLRANPRASSASTELDALVKEIAVMKALDHPNVVALFEVVTHVVVRLPLL